MLHNFSLNSTKSQNIIRVLFWQISTIAPATVISIQYNLSFAKYDYLYTTDS